MTLRAVPVDFDEKWKNLEGVCQKVIRGVEGIRNPLWCNCFSDIYSLCVARPESQAFKLYNAVTQILRDRITELLGVLSSTDDENFLCVYTTSWDNYHKGLLHLHSLLSFVNTQYVSSRRPCEADMLYGDALSSPSTHNMEILQLGLSLWKSILLDSIQTRLTASLLEEVAKDRSGIISHQECISPCLESFLRVDELKGLTKVALNVYLELFDKPLIEESRVCYSQWANDAKQLPCTEFLTEALKFLNSEISRASKYYIYSHQEIINLFNDIVVQQQVEFLNAHIPLSIQTEDKEVLSKFYQLLSPTDNCAELIRQFGLHVKQKINEVLVRIPVDKSEASSYFVDNLMVVRNHFIQLIDDVFEGKSNYRDEMDRVFQQSINSTVRIERPPATTLSLSYRTPRTFGTSASSTGDAPSRTSDQVSNSARVAQYLNRYLDDIHRRPDHRALSEEEIYEKISAAFVLFKYLEEKDLFKQFYQKSLSYRLLFNPTTDLNLEEVTIAKLKEVCGSEFTSKFHRMHSDMQLCETLNRDFRQYLTNASISLPFSHEFHVLTINAWPINAEELIRFNAQSGLKECINHFEEFYKTKYNGRNLKWVLNSCTADTRLLFTKDGRAYSVMLSALHASTLALFDSLDVDQMTIGALRLNLLNDEPGTDGILTMAVKPLVEAGFLRMLTADGLSETKEFKNDTIIALNRDYTNRHLKLKFTYNPSALLNATTAANQKDEIEQAESEAQEDRKLFLQAAIVRILKARKTMKHADLLQAVISAAEGRFVPSVTLIKRTIEHLIDKSYVERNPGDAESYNYLA